MTAIELLAGLTSIAPTCADRCRVRVQRVVRRAVGSRLRVTALNSTPVIFYPTDTFAELEPRCSQVLFRTAFMVLCMQVTRLLASRPRATYSYTADKCVNVLICTGNVLREHTSHVVRASRSYYRNNQTSQHEPTTLTRNRHCAGIPPSAVAGSHKPGPSLLSSGRRRRDGVARCSALVFNSQRYCNLPFHNQASRRDESRDARPPQLA
jgi:hypothetical protein